MPLTVACPCGQKLQVKDEMAGRRGKCPACGKVFTIPSPAAKTSDPLGPLGGDDPLGALGDLDLASMPEMEGGADPLGAPQAGGLGPSPGLAGPAWPGAQAAGQADNKDDSGSRRKMIFILGGAGGLLLIVLAVVLCLFLFGGGGGDSDNVASGDNSASATNNNTPTQPPPPPPNPDPAKDPAESAAPSLTVKLVSGPSVTVEPGKTAKIEVEVDPGEHQDPVQLSIDALPEKMTVKTDGFAAGQVTATVDLTVAADAEEGTSNMNIIASAGKARGQQPVSIIVKKAPLPSFTPLAAVSLSPGGSASVKVGLDREGFNGPIQITVDGLPAKVTAQPLQVAADQNSANLQLAAAADTPDAAKSVRVLANAGGRVVETELHITIERFAFRVLPPAEPVVWIAPGESHMVDVKVERRSYKGPIEIGAEGLPEGVTAAPTTIAADQLAGKMELTAAADAKDRVRSAKLVTKTASSTNSSPQVLIVRVTGGEGNILPEVNVDQELSSNLRRRGSFGGRLTAESKQLLMDVYGGTEESEDAVLEGLHWLSLHQAPDGRWSLKSYHQASRFCDCRTETENELDDNDTAGTAFGLLPLLAAGVTPEKAPEEPRELFMYRSNVKAGLRFLIAKQKRSSDDKNGELGGGMYAHALGTMALCEAYALTGDQEIKVPAQMAVRYLINAQGGTGGWRYGPKQDGDTSVVGWVFLAIRSGQLSGIPFSSTVLDKAGRFLNTTAAGPEPHKLSRYSYTPGGQANLQLTAAGLLSRQYLGWPKDRPELATGATYLMQNLPPESGDKLGNIYAYYYMTQVLHHLEDKQWDLWNHRIREHLIRTQQKSGHAKGSWSPEGVPYGDRGGRLYSTALSLLTLEAYYRHLPLYRNVPTPSQAN